MVGFVGEVDGHHVRLIVAGASEPVKPGPRQNFLALFRRHLCDYHRDPSLNLELFVVAESQIAGRSCDLCTSGRWYVEAARASPPLGGKAGQLTRSSSRALSRTMEPTPTFHRQIIDFKLECSCHSSGRRLRVIIRIVP